jgi:hypothetical protein
MSEKIITLNDHPKGNAGSRNEELTATKARLQWMADLVCAILDPESINKVIRQW